jgi:hypothetical protein
VRHDANPESKTSRLVTISGLRGFRHTFVEISGTSSERLRRGTSSAPCFNATQGGSLRLTKLPTNISYIIHRANTNPTVHQGEPPLACWRNIMDAAEAPLRLPHGGRRIAVRCRNPHFRNLRRVIKILCGLISLWMRYFYARGANLRNHNQKPRVCASFQTDCPGYIFLTFLPSIYS